MANTKKFVIIIFHNHNGQYDQCTHLIIITCIGLSLAYSDDPRQYTFDDNVVDIKALTEKEDRT